MKRLILVAFALAALSGGAQTSVADQNMAAVHFINASINFRCYAPHQFICVI